MAGVKNSVSAQLICLHLGRFVVKRGLGPLGCEGNKVNTAHCKSLQPAKFCVFTPFCSIRTGVQYGFAPAVAEDYSKHEQGLSSYAVALIKTNLSKEISLKSLKSRKSCHPAAGYSVGWTAPVGLLIGNEAMQWKECNPYQSAVEYFQQSCVPGLWFI